MVQLESNLGLTLESLGPSGATVTFETKAALDHSLSIKKADAAIATISFWGRILTINGKDYLIAEGYNKPRIVNGDIILDVKYYYSQDAVKWVDLAKVDPEVANHARSLSGQLSGDPSQVYTIEQTSPDAPASPEGEGEDDEEAGKLVIEISELQRLSTMIEDIAADCSVVPKGCETITADCNIVPNYSFIGMDYPDKLESYVHRKGGPTGPSLAKNIRGTWSLQTDPFKGTVVIRSLVWIGYVFSYNARTLTWGSLYVGDGTKNNDLAFMI